MQLGPHIPSLTKLLTWAQSPCAKQKTHFHNHLSLPSQIDCSWGYNLSSCPIKWYNLQTHLTPTNTNKTWDFHFDSSWVWICHQGQNSIHVDELMIDKVLRYTSPLLSNTTQFIIMNDWKPVFRTIIFILVVFTAKLSEGNSLGNQLFIQT